MSEPFEYPNLIGRPSGPFLRTAALLSKGVRSVQQHIPAYAKQWAASNIAEIASDKPLWIVLGDSMAQGIGASSYDRGWPGYLRKLLQSAGREYKLINLSISGSRISDVLERQIPAMQALGEQPALVTVMVGSNDQVRKRYRQKAPDEFLQLLNVLPAGSVVSNLPGHGAMQRAIDRHARDAAARGHITLVDMRRSGPRDWRGKLASDHFHPNDAGYQALAKVFARAMQLL